MGTCFFTSVFHTHPHSDLLMIPEYKSMEKNSLIISYYYAHRSLSFNFILDLNPPHTLYIHI